jgi:hypothetical protein
MSYGVMAPSTVKQQPATILSGKTVGPVVDISRWRAGAFRTPAGATATSYTFNVSNTGLVMYPLRDAAGAAISQTVVANKWFALPPSAFNYKQLQLVPNAAPGTNQGVFLTGTDGPASWVEIVAPVAVGAAPTITVPLEGASAGSFLIPAGWTGATVTFERGAGPGDLSPLVDAANANVTQAVAADRLLTIPAAAFGASHLRVVAVSVQAGGGLVRFWLKQEG